MLLLGRGLFWVSSLLDVYDEFRLRLVLVHWPGRVVYLVAINVEAACLPCSRPAEPIVASQYYPCYTHKSTHMVGLGQWPGYVVEVERQVAKLRRDCARSLKRV